MNFLTLTLGRLSDSVRSLWAEQGGLLAVAVLLLLVACLLLSTLSYRRRLERGGEALRLANRRLSLATSVAGVGVWEWVPDKSRLDWNPVMFRLHGVVPEKDFSLPDWKARLLPDDLSAFEALIARPGAEGRELELRVQRQDDGEVRILKTSCQWQLCAAGWHLVGSQIDITEEQGTKRRLFRDVYRDALTGLQNARALNERLGQQIARHERRRGQQALLFIDLDGFKAVNDTWGHDAGDRLLQGAANRMRLALRHEDQVFRLGGDEFVVLLHGAFEDTGILERIAGKLIGTLSEPYDCDGHWCRVSASIGIARAPGDAQTPEALLKAADTAMYQAKTGGKNRFCFYTDASLCESECQKNVS
ncbi:hypothetical protein GCM10011348_44960 [Marinobacterium nitratireducens]|uniref:GGDEF domain-containing protein n=1 Tax=Marinobacterium nitratireducens TaxID=518897 RepID=A0A917ZRF0_9GAMM|nr:GGDEF domain-containing protein [Marinobacterium nitratireducens]GGO88759.1 hypothetical protein GCM10011348_44960 [Marinobacterium nitratireducens]